VEGAPRGEGEEGRRMLQKGPGEERWVGGRVSGGAVL